MGVGREGCVGAKNPDAVREAVAQLHSAGQGAAQKAACLLACCAATTLGTAAWSRARAALSGSLCCRSAASTWPCRGQGGGRPA